MLCCAVGKKIVNDNRSKQRVYQLRHVGNYHTETTENELALIGQHPLDQTADTTFTLFIHRIPPPPVLHKRWHICR